MFIKAMTLAAIIAFTITPIEAQKGKPVPKQPPAATVPAPEAPKPDPSQKTLDMYCMKVEEATAKIKEDSLQLLFAGKLRYGLFTIYANPKTRAWVSLLIPTVDQTRACVIGAAEGYRLEFPGFPA